MKKILNKIGQALQVVLMAPIKIPAKAVNILKYIAVGLGILETVLDDGDAPTEVLDQQADAQIPDRVERSGQDEAE